MQFRNPKIRELINEAEEILKLMKSDNEELCDDETRLYLSDKFIENMNEARILIKKEKNEKEI